MLPYELLDDILVTSCIFSVGLRSDYLTVILIVIVFLGFILVIIRRMTVGLHVLSCLLGIHFGGIHFPLLLSRSLCFGLKSFIIITLVGFPNLSLLLLSCLNH